MLRFAVITLLAIAACEAAVPVFRAWEVKSPGSYNSANILTTPEGITYYGNTNGTLQAINTTSGMVMWMFYSQGGYQFYSLNYTDMYIIFVRSSTFGVIYRNNGSLAWEMTPTYSLAPFQVLLNPWWVMLFDNAAGVLKVNLMTGEYTRAVGTRTPVAQPLWWMGNGLIIHSTGGMYFYNMTSNGVGWSFTLTLSSARALWYNNSIIVGGYESLVWVDPMTGQKNSFDLDTTTSTTPSEVWLYTNATGSTIVTRQTGVIVTFDLKLMQIVAKYDFNSYYIRTYGFTMDGALIVSHDNNLKKYNFWTGMVLNTTQLGSYSSLPQNVYVAGDQLIVVLYYDVFTVSSETSMWFAGRNYKSDSSYVLVSAWANNNMVLVGDGYKLIAVEPFSTTIPAYTFDAGSTVTTGFLEWMGVMYFATYDNRFIGIGMMNGSVTVNVLLPHSQSAYAPVYYNGKILLSRSTNTDSDIGVMAVDPWGRGAVTTMTASGCSYAPSMLVVDTSSGVYFSCETNAIYKISSDWTVKSAATTSTVSNTRPPTLGNSLVYATDYYGYVTAFSKSLFSAKTWVTATAINSVSGSATYYDGYVYGSSTREMTAIGASTNTVYWTLKQQSKNNAYFKAAPIVSVGKLVTVDDESNAWIINNGFKASKDGPTADVSAIISVGDSSAATAWATTAIGSLLVSKSDMMVSIDVATGKQQWNNTEKYCAGFKYDRGLIYATCNNQWTVIGAMNGVAYLRTNNFAPSAAIIKNGTIYYASGSTVSEFSINAAGADIPIPNSPSTTNSDDGEKESSKLWIVGVVAAVVVIAVVILVLYKVCGSKDQKTDGEYYPMQGTNPNSSNQV